MVNFNQIACRAAKLETMKLHMDSMFTNLNSDGQVSPLEPISTIIDEQIGFLKRFPKPREIIRQKNDLQRVLDEHPPILVVQENSQVDLQWLQRVIQEEIGFLDDLVQNER